MNRQGLQVNYYSYLRSTDEERGEGPHTLRSDRQVRPLSSDLQAGPREAGPREAGMDPHHEELMRLSVRGE